MLWAWKKLGFNFIACKQLASASSNFPCSLNVIAKILCASASFGDNSIDLWLAIKASETLPVFKYIAPRIFQANWWFGNLSVRKIASLSALPSLPFW